MLQDRKPVFLSEKEITFGLISGSIKTPDKVDYLFTFNNEIDWKF